jgi:hypothetical protein
MSLRKVTYHRRNCVRFEVFASVTLKNTVIFDVIPCGSCKNVTSLLQELHDVTS